MSATALRLSTLPTAGDHVRWCGVRFAIRGVTDSVVLMTYLDADMHGDEDGKPRWEPGAHGQLEHATFLSDAVTL